MAGFFSLLFFYFINHFHFDMAKKNHTLNCVAFILE